LSAAGVPPHATGATSLGTAWVEYRYVPPGGTQTLVRVPVVNNRPASNRPLVVFLHGNAAAETQVLSSEGMDDAWLDEGYAFLATRAGSSGWGNDAERTAYDAAIADALTRFHGSGDILLYSRSMGGLTGLHLLATLSGVRGWAGNGAVCDLRAAYDDDQLDQYVETAYDIPGSGDYDTQAAGHDPLLFDLIAYAGKRLRGYAANDDNDVPRAEHLDALMAYVDSVATENEVVTVSGGHIGADSWRIGDLIEFYQRCLA
jgi:pimeloyl-ACP methyl ester carboxylesterase